MHCFKMRILEMQLLGIVVHHFNKLPLPTGNIVSQSNTSVISGIHN
ncbi:Uncharacterised protein [Shigella sonnei]|nr:Uncharacterised protein [Shigella sonnei]